LLFAHGHILRVLTGVALSLGPRAGAHFVLDPATISVIGTEHGARALLRWNECIS
jgi:probable phosphoglycerate mutase